MYTVGLQSAADAFLVSSLKVQVVLALLILFTLLVLGHGSSKDDLSAQTPVYLPGSHLLAIAPFFRRRFDFLNDGFRKTGEKLFQFNMLRVRPPPTFRTSTWVLNVISRRPSSSCPGSQHEKHSSQIGLSI